MSDNIVKKYQEAASQCAILDGGGSGGLVDWEKDVTYPGGAISCTTGAQREAMLQADIKELQDRIEQLEAALREISQAVGDPAAYWIARAALGEKKDEQ
jgi:hypothetical protein